MKKVRKLFVDCYYSKNKKQNKRKSKEMEKNQKGQSVPFEKKGKKKMGGNPSSFEGTKNFRKRTFRLKPFAERFASRSVERKQILLLQRWASDTNQKKVSNWNVNVAGQPESIKRVSQTLFQQVWRVGRALAKKTLAPSSIAYQKMVYSGKKEVGMLRQLELQRATYLQRRLKKTDRRMKPRASWKQLWEVGKTEAGLRGPVGYFQRNEYGEIVGYAGETLFGTYRIEKAKGGKGRPRSSWRFGWTEEALRASKARRAFAMNMQSEEKEAIRNQFLWGMDETPSWTMPVDGTKSEFFGTNDSIQENQDSMQQNLPYERLKETGAGWLYAFGRWQTWSSWRSVSTQMTQWWARRGAARKAQEKFLLGWWIHIHSTYTNTIATVTDYYGNTYFQMSAGQLGFKKARRASPYAAIRVGEEIGLWVTYHQELMTGGKAKIYNPFQAGGRRRPPFTKTFLFLKRKQYANAARSAKYRAWNLAERRNHRAWMANAGKSAGNWLSTVRRPMDVHVLFRGVGVYRASVMKGLASTHCQLSVLWEGARRPHNGCRKPKRRRL
uniref:30S ribosomal protein S11 n=1 Tax=Hemiarma marina TaxID=1848298 RepID=A0A679EJQ6_9CRYP|nr:30S ribosomal protein S11 [Hemiarma marina]